MEPTKEELAQLELGIADLERRISETASGISIQPGAFGSNGAPPLHGADPRGAATAQTSRAQTA